VITPSILSTIPDLLKRILIENIEDRKSQVYNNILVSSNNLANRFIFEQWGIRSSQRRYYKNLFSEIREFCRNLFRHYERRGSIEYQENIKVQRVSIFKFDEIRGNLILGFNPVDKDHPFNR